MIGRTAPYNWFTFGWCTWGAAQQLHNYLGVYPGWTGDGWAWAIDAAAVGWRVTSTPHVHSIAVYPAGVDMAGSLGHVAWVTSVNWYTHTYVILEMDGPAGWDHWDYRTVAFDGRVRFILS